MMGFESSGIKTTSSWSLWKTTREFIEKARRAAVVDVVEIGKPRPRSNCQPPRTAHPSPNRRLSVNPKPRRVLPKLFFSFLLWKTERERRTEGENGEERESRGKKIEERENIGQNERQRKKKKKSLNRRVKK
jgi:hypothetical protein